MTTKDEFLTEAEAAGVTVSPLGNALLSVVEDMEAGKPFGFAHAATLGIAAGQLDRLLTIETEGYDPAGLVIVENQQELIQKAADEKAATV